MAQESIMFIHAYGRERMNCVTVIVRTSVHTILTSVFSFTMFTATTVLCNSITDCCNMEISRIIILEFWKFIREISGILFAWNAENPVMWCVTVPWRVSVPQDGVVRARQRASLAGQGWNVAVSAGQPTRVSQHGVHRLLLRGRLWGQQGSSRQDRVSDTHLCT